MRLAVELEYDGSAYHGWQIQPNALTVQEVIEKTFSKYFNEDIAVTGCGRTDTGVHAKHFVLHFDLSGEVQSKAVYSLNQMLPGDIALRRILHVPDDFHARFDAVFRTYRYFVARDKTAFNRNYHYHFQPRSLDVEAMNKAAEYLVGTGDFASFCKVGSEVKTTICTVKEAQWNQQLNRLDFTITADRFLRNMVRAVVGTLIEVGTGLKSPEDLPSILAESNRSKAGRSVPAHGLFLWQVGYEHLNGSDVLSH